MTYVVRICRICGKQFETGLFPQWKCDQCSIHDNVVYSDHTVLNKMKQ